MTPEALAALAHHEELTPAVLRSVFGVTRMTAAAMLLDLNIAGLVYLAEPADKALRKPPLYRWVGE